MNRGQTPRGLALMTAESSLSRDPQVRPDAGKPPEDAASVFPELAGFRIIQELGRSPKGLIFKARRLVEQDIVAVKVYREATALESGFREHLRRNAEASFLLEHPGLVRCLGCQETDGRLLLIMEFARGEPLSRALQRNVRFLPPRALSIVIQCANALRYASTRQRFHGRLHPGDVVLQEQEVRLLGVGLGERPEHAAWQVKDAHLFEPLIYVAPEGLPSREPPASDSARRALDLFALGGLLYHMLTGSPPFHSSDEGSLVQERAAGAPHPVRWPRGADFSLPQRAIRLVERLMAARPEERGDYDLLLGSAEEALAEAEGRQASAPAARTALPPLPPLELAQAAPLAPPASPPAPAPPGAPSAPGAPAAPRAFRKLSTLRLRRDEYRSGNLISFVLICAVVYVFGFASGLAVKTFLLSPLAQGPQAAQGGGPAGADGAGPAPQPVAKAPPAVEPPAKSKLSEAEGEAAWQLETVEEMLKTGEAKYNHATLRVVQEILDKVGPTTRTGMKARLLFSEISERIAGVGLGANARPLPGRAGSEAEEKVFREHLARGREIAAEHRFGRAIDHLRALPDSLKLAPFPEQLEQEVQKLEREAMAAYAEQSAQAETALNAGDHARARGIYQTIRAKFGIRKWEEASDLRLKAIGEDEDRARKAELERNADQKLREEQQQWQKVLLEAIPLAMDFKYDQARNLADKFAAAAQLPKMRDEAQGYSRMLQDEKWIFARSQTRLKEEIQAKGSSPIEVKSAKSKDAKGAEIIAFDENGLTYVVVKDKVKGEMHRQWESINPLQPIVMIQLLMDKTNPAEHRALATMAFHRAARLSLDLPKVKAEEVGDQKTAIEQFKKLVAESFNAAIQADPRPDNRAATEKQRGILSEALRLATSPPPAAEKAKD